MWKRLALAAAVVAAVAAWTWLAWPASEVRPVAGAERNAAVASHANEPARGSPTEREAAPGVGTETEGETFVSESEDDGVVANAVRDGIAILVLDANRAPLANAKLDVRWRKGWGLYGNDRGRTDAQGRFATTIAEPEMIEGVTLKHPELGELQSWFSFLSMANDPRTVLVIVPALQPVAVRVVDERGAPIPSAQVAFENGPADLVPREFRLLPVATVQSVDRDGRVLLRLAIGPYKLTAQASGYRELYELTVSVPDGGCARTLHLLGATDLHDVAVHVEVPASLRKEWHLLVVEGHSSHLPNLPDLAADGVEAKQRKYESRRVDLNDSNFVVAVPATPWRCGANLGEVWGAVDVGAFDTSATVVLKEPPPRAVARLRCKLLLPDGQECAGQVIVHTQPDLVSGSRYSVQPSAPFVEVEPGGAACVSAWRDGYPHAIVGPIELKLGEQEVVLQFPRPMSIRGRVIDEQGKPAAATVNLCRPAGPLQALASGVPAFLRSAAEGDSITCSDDGRFSFENVGAGEHELQVWPPPQVTAWPARVRVVPGDQDVVVHFGDGIEQMARITGRVTEADTGKPAVGAQVTWAGGGEVHTVFADTDGRYALVMLPGQLEAGVRQRRCAFFELEPKAFAAGVHTVDIALEKSEPLFVRVRDANGRTPKLDVSAFDAKGRAIAFVDHNGGYDGDSVSLDANGRAELGGLPHGAVRLHLCTEDEKESMDVDVPANTPRTVELAITWNPTRK